MLTKPRPLHAANLLQHAFCDIINEGLRGEDYHLVGRIRDDDTVEVVPCPTEQIAIALRDRLPPEERFETIQPLYTGHYLMPGLL
jgi:hypothetical protein